MSEDVPAAQDPMEEIIRRERARIDKRRTTLGRRPDEPIIGLALSGGGIRSATFSLGVLQALSRHLILPRIDYISSVSGGSFIAGFLGALFVDKDLRGPVPKTDLATTPHPAPAVEAMDPLGSARGKKAMARLRESGRYLAPGGTSDAFIAAAIILRNWISLQLVLGFAVVALFGLLHLADTALLSWAVTQPYAEHLTTSYGFSSAAFKTSPVLGALFALSVIVVCSLGLGYWFTRREVVKPGRTKRIIQNPFFLGMLAAAMTVIWVAHEVDGIERAICVVAVVIIALAILFYVDAELRHGERLQNSSNLAALVAAEDQVRTSLSRSLSHALNIAGLVAAFWIIDAIARWMVAESTSASWSSQAIAGGALSAITLAARFITSGKVQKLRTAAASPAVRSIAIGSLGLLLLGLWLVFWDGVTLLLTGIDITYDEPAFVPQVFIVGGAWAGCFVGSISFTFINLSSLCTFYAARLRRAYLGASNESEEKDTEQFDDIMLGEYYAGTSHAPIHLINVTIADTFIDKSSLTARDRKGKHMHVGPEGIVHSGDTPAEFKVHPHQGSESMPLSMWTAVSGAAFSTAVGARSSLGLSIITALSNIRLGYWWKPRAGNNRDRQAWREALSGNCMQFYLFNELRGRFRGTRRRRWYLTDGGHFDNTGIYTLLQRKAEFIIACDNGADADYEFNDIVNLLLKARTDLGAHIAFLEEAELDAAIANPDLRKCLGSFRKLTGRLDAGKPGGPFAAVARISYVDAKDGQPGSGMLLLIKPRLCFNEPPELLAYHYANIDFPQQTTVDQFFDESQWEAYRRLGELCGDRLFDSNHGLMGKVLGQLAEP